LRCGTHPLGVPDRAARTAGIERVVFRHHGEMPDTVVTISLTGDEAFLFDLLHRWEDNEQVGAPKHHAEQVALWNLSALLERELREPFDPAIRSWCRARGLNSRPASESPLEHERIAAVRMWLSPNGWRNDALLPT
jgi:hypothetical protein